MDAIAKCEIPNIIHYCWFGKGEKTELAKQCIISWRHFFPNHTIIEWNEENVDIESAIPYVREAYKAGKFAFVSDYCRLQALYNYGGIYFDTDYEVLKPMDILLERGGLVSGFESENSILTAIIACEKKNPIIGHFLEGYQQRHFLNGDGSYDMQPINVGFNRLLEENGVDLTCNAYQEIDNKIYIYPIEILCGFDVENWHERITENTIGVHHMSNSWATPEMKKHIKRIQLIQNILGYNLYDKLKRLLKGK